MYICTVCNNSFENKIFKTKEMMFGYNDEFKYLLCSECGCLQITQIPEDMTKYYPSKYYSFSKKDKKKISNKIKDYLLPCSMKFRIGISKSIIGWISNLRYNTTFPWLTKDFGKYFKNSVLDVGCGSGSLLSYLKKTGFEKLTGIDPYLSEDTIMDDFSLLKKEIFDLKDKFHLIMFHHSFEHMENPNKVFETLNLILEDDGLIVIRIPVVDSFAWRKYGTSWFALDAPRHLFLHSVKSVNYLAEKYGFYIEKIMYDSTWQQFYFSESYQRNIPLNGQFNEFTKKDIKNFQNHADILNKMKDGDQACFYIKKKVKI